jgi:hypothetical protein
MKAILPKGMDKNKNGLNDVIELMQLAIKQRGQLLLHDSY